MKKLSKGLLALVLAMAMMLSVMPMSFAAEEETATEHNVTITYDTRAAMLADSYKDTSGSTGRYKKYLTYDNSHNLFEYVADSYSDKYSSSGKLTSINMFEYAEKKYIMFEIYVPVAGTYTLKTNPAKLEKETELSLYVAPKSDSVSYSSLFVDGNFAGTVDDLESGIYGASPYEATAAYAKSFIKDEKEAAYTFSQGYYNVGFLVSENAATDTQTFRFANLHLVSGDGSENALVGNMTLSSDYVKAGETATATATAYKSDDWTATAVTYASSDETVATVDSEGNITTLKAGKTTITATATGSVGSLSRELTVRSANASDVTVKYDLMKYADDNTTKHAELYNYNTTNGLFKYVYDYTQDLKFNWERTFINNTLQLAEKRYEVFEINVPVAGEYDVKVYYGTDDNGGDMNVYIFKSNGEEKIGATELAQQNIFGVVNCCNESDTNTKINPVAQDDPKNLGAYTFEKGKYFFAAHVPDDAVTGYKYAFISGFTLDGGSGDALMGHLNGSTTLRNDETATLSGYLSSTGDAATVTYASSNDCVTVGTDGTITAVAPGNATITMTASDSTVVADANTYEVEIAVPDADLQAAFDATPEAATDYVAPSVAGIEIDGGVITPVSNGDGSFNLTAPDKKGEKEFLYWAKGMETKKRIVSFSETLEKYVPDESGKTYLIAVYEGDITDTTNEYYNLNGQLIAKQATAPALPSIPGLGTAEDWESCGENIFVAKYADMVRDKVTVTVDGKEDTVAYGTSVTCTADETKGSFKCWTKKGVNEETAEIVSVEKTYTFNAWEDCTVTAVYEVHNPLASAMKIFIDSFAVGSETGVMAEFIGITDAVEKGIMFTDSENNTTKIAMTTTDDQFSVIADAAGTYVGYVIIRETDGLKLITDGSYVHN